MQDQMISYYPNGSQIKFHSRTSLLEVHYQNLVQTNSGHETRTQLLTWPCHPSQKLKPVSSQKVFVKPALESS